MLTVDIVIYVTICEIMNKATFQRAVVYVTKKPNQ